MASDKKARVSESVAEKASNQTVSEQIQTALEIMKRVRMGNTAQAAHIVEEPKGNSYVLPEPLILHAS